jgi:hypothetical protein
MPFRTFRDSRGIDWQVYDVVPRTDDDRRAGERRSGEIDLSTVDFDRRGLDRRVAVGARPSRRITQGWLCFERDEVKCRLSPIPEDWQTASDEQLEAWCREARPAPARSAG